MTYYATKAVSLVPPSGQSLHFIYNLSVYVFVHVNVCAYVLCGVSVHVSMCVFSRLLDPVTGQESLAQVLLGLLDAVLSCQS